MQHTSNYHCSHDQSAILDLPSSNTPTVVCPLVQPFIILSHFQCKSYPFAHFCLYPSLSPAISLSLSLSGFPSPPLPLPPLLSPSLSLLRSKNSNKKSDQHNFIFSSPKLVFNPMISFNLFTAFYIFLVSRLAFIILRDCLNPSG